MSSITQIEARDLSVGMMLIPGPGNRGFRVESVRPAAGKFQLEVQVAGQGTVHFRTHETVTVRVSEVNQ